MSRTWAVANGYAVELWVSSAFRADKVLSEDGSVGHVVSMPSSASSLIVESPVPV